MTPGKMIWFNAAKGHGYLRTEDDERLYVPAGAFAPGEAPAGRCGGLDVLVERHGDEAVRVVFVAEAVPPRARLRHGRAGRAI